MCCSVLLIFLYLNGSKTLTIPKKETEAQDIEFSFLVRDIMLFLLQWPHKTDFNVKNLRHFGMQLWSVSHPHPSAHPGLLLWLDVNIFMKMISQDILQQDLLASRKYQRTVFSYGNVWCSKGTDTKKTERLMGTEWRIEETDVCTLCRSNWDSVFGYRCGNNKSDWCQSWAWVSDTLESLINTLLLILHQPLFCFSQAYLIVKVRTSHTTLDEMLL